MLPFHGNAASFIPFAEEVIACQFFIAPVEVTSVQFAPLLLEVHMLPPDAPDAIAASFVPSAEEVIPTQVFVAPTDSFRLPRR